MRMLRGGLLLGLAIVAPPALISPALAQSPSNADLVTDPDATAQGDVSVTIYNGNTALVQDVRQLPIPAGTTRIEFPDVSAQIMPQTLSFAAADAAIVEQNFDFDLLTPQKLMEKAIGQTITLVRTNPATGQEVRERATVLSTAGGVVVKIGDRIEVLRDDGLPVRAIFDRVPPNLRARPTLSVTVESARSGTRPAQIRYLTPGLGWSADYVALFDEAKGTLDMQGWVTLTNSTGTTYNNARTLLVAGTLYGRQGAPGFGSRPGITEIGTETASREQLGDFYLYPIAERTTIANAQTKQVSFLDVQSVPASRVYTHTVGWGQNDTQPLNVRSAIAFSSSRDGGLGDALPAGTVRFYQRDMRGQSQFVGEDSIDHTPMGSSLRLETGDAFDVAVKTETVSRERITADQWRVTERFRVTQDDSQATVYTRERPDIYFRTNMRYTLTNAQSTPAMVELVQAGLDRGWWSRDFRVPSESIPGEQINADQRRWRVEIPANGETVVTVSFDTRY